MWEKKRDLNDKKNLQVERKCCNFPTASQEIERCTRNAGLAQLVEQLICNHQVVSSSLTSGSIP